MGGKSISMILASMLCAAGAGSDGYVSYNELHRRLPIKRASVHVAAKKLQAMRLVNIVCRDQGGTGIEITATGRHALDRALRIPNQHPSAMPPAPAIDGGPEVARAFGHCQPAVDDGQII